MSRFLPDRDRDDHRAVDQPDEQHPVANPPLSLPAWTRHFTIHPFAHLSWHPLFDEAGHPLVGIRGKQGSCGLGLDAHELGADWIEMQPGTAFALHTHPGDHLLYAISGCGTITMGGVVRMFAAGSTCFIPGASPHAVGNPGDEPLLLLAVGHPHKPLTAHDRMTLVPEEPDESTLIDTH